MLINPNFNDGWTDLPPTPDFLINQQPVGWRLRWLEPGDQLWDANDLARGIPECVHKHQNTLPPDEQPGQPNALMLKPPYVYKIFHAGLSFGAELAQTVANLKPGTTGRFFVRTLLDLHGDEDAYAAEIFVGVNGVGRWANSEMAGNRKWHEIMITFPVDSLGQANIIVRVKSKWPTAKDFFFDNFSLEAAPAVDPPPPTPKVIPIPDGATGIIWRYEWSYE